jgi:hypothetical protein
MAYTFTEVIILVYYSGLLGGVRRELQIEMALLLPPRLRPLLFHWKLFEIFIEIKNQEELVHSA